MDITFTKKDITAATEATNQAVDNEPEVNQKTMKGHVT